MTVGQHWANKSYSGIRPLNVHEQLRIGGVGSQSPQTHANFTREILPVRDEMKTDSTATKVFTLNQRWLSHFRLHSTDRSALPENTLKIFTTVSEVSGTIQCGTPSSKNQM